MVSPYVKAELTAAVSSLGYADLGKYYKDQYCLGKAWSSYNLFRILVINKIVLNVYHF